MAFSVAEPLTALLLRLSEGGPPAILSGRTARPHAGAALDQLLAAGVLSELAPAETWPVCIDCNCGFPARPIQHVGDRILAACPIDAAADAELEGDDLRAFLIDPDALARSIAEASGCRPAVEPLAPGVWRVGRLDSGRWIVIAFAGSALDQPGIALLLRAATDAAALTVIAPEPGPALRLRFVEAGIDLVDLASALQPCGPGIDRLNPAALEPGTANPRLRLERRARRTILDGRFVHLSEQTFDLLLFLAERAVAGPETVDVRVIEDRVWGAGIHRIVSGIREPVRALRDALAAGAEDANAARALIENTRNPNGYRLALAAAEVAIID
jgi:hypothetical protein